MKVRLAKTSPFILDCKIRIIPLNLAIFLLFDRKCRKMSENFLCLDATGKNCNYAFQCVDYNNTNKYNVYIIIFLIELTRIIENLEDKSRL